MPLAAAGSPQDTFSDVELTSEKAKKLGLPGAGDGTERVSGIKCVMRSHFQLSMGLTVPSELLGGSEPGRGEGGTPGPQGRCPEGPLPVGLGHRLPCAPLGAREPSCLGGPQCPGEAPAPGSPPRPPPGLLRTWPVSAAVHAAGHVPGKHDTREVLNPLDGREPRGSGSSPHRPPNLTPPGPQDPIKSLLELPGPGPGGRPLGPLTRVRSRHQETRSTGRVGGTQSPHCALRETGGSAPRAPGPSGACA